MRNRVLWVSLGVMLLGVLTAGYLSRRMALPLANLAESMTEFGRGEALKGLPFTGGGKEVADLTISFNRMIFDREETVKALRESEERFRRLTENAPDVIYRMSLPDGGYEYVSPASEIIFGYTPEEFRSSPMLIQKIIHPDWREYFKKQWAKLLAGDMPPYYEYQILHKSGEVRYLHQNNVSIYL